VRTAGDQNRLKAFVAQHAPERHRNGMLQMLTFLHNHGIPARLADFFGGDTKCGPYRLCTNSWAQRRGARRITSGIDKSILLHPLLRNASTALVDVGSNQWAGNLVFVLKGAVMTPSGILPVEATRAEDVRDLPGLVHEHFARLISAGLRLPHLTTSNDASVVDMMVNAVSGISMEWTGPVSPTWALTSRGAEWTQPSCADVLSVGDALAWPLSDQASGPERFAFAKLAGDRLLVAYRSKEGRHYLHRSHIVASQRVPYLTGIQERVRESVARIEELSDPLTEFPIERLRIPVPKLATYRHVSRRILLGWQFGLGGDKAVEESISEVA
jgi:hypothetical protein